MSDASEVPAARVVLFVLASALLIATAIAFSRGASGPDEPSGLGAASEPRAASQSGELPASLARAKSEVETAARLFLAAFLRYEVGELTPGVRRALVATTTPPFGRQLLSAPARRPPAGAFPPRAELRRIDVAFISPEATLATVEGTAVRAGFAEEFGFVFALSPRGWLASGASR